MTIREMTEQREAEYFSPYASFSKDTKGRERMEEPCDIQPSLSKRPGPDSPLQILSEIEA